MFNQINSPKGKHKFWTTKRFTELQQWCSSLEITLAKCRKQSHVIPFVTKSTVSKCILECRTAEACLKYPLKSKAYKYSIFTTFPLPVQRDVGVQNGSCHCFGTGIVTHCSQANCARFSTQTVSFFLHICLYFQSLKEREKVTYTTTTVKAHFLKISGTL